MLMMIRLRWSLPGMFFALLVSTVLFSGVTANAKQPSLPEGDDRATVHVVIGIDISKGSPFTTKNPVTTKTAERIGELIEDLPNRALVSLRTFGGHSTAQSELFVDRQVSPRRPAASLSTFIKTLVAGMPKLIETGKLVPHDQSSIVGFLHSMARSARCADRPTIVILATDGLEDSDVADLRKGGSLPKPGSIYDGCARLEMLGIGQGAGSFTLTERLIAEWKKWSESAGFRSFVGLDTW